MDRQLPKAERFFDIPDIFAGGILFFISHMVKLSPEILAVFRTVAKANSYSELETAVPFWRLRAASVLLVEAHERAVKQAAERKEARRWTPTEDEILRLGFREGQTVGELAEQLGRTPLVVKNRLATLGLLKIANIRRAPTEQPNTSPAREIPFEPTAASVNPQPEKGPDTEPTIGTGDTTDDEQIDSWVDHMNREQEDLAAIAQQEHEERLEEWERADESWQAFLRDEAAAGTQLASEDAAHDTNLLSTDAGAAASVPEIAGSSFCGAI